MLMPKRVKYRKAQRGRMRGKAQRGSTLAFGGLMFEVVWLYASHGYRLIRKDMDKRLIRLGKVLILATPVLYSAAALLALVDPYFPLAIFGIVPLLYVIPGPIDDLVAGAERT